MFSIKALDQSDCKTILATFSQLDGRPGEAFATKIELSKTAIGNFGDELISIEQAIGKLLFDTSAKLFAYPKEIIELSYVLKDELSYSKWSSQRGTDSNLVFILFLASNENDNCLKIWKGLSGKRINIFEGQLVIFHADYNSMIVTDDKNYPSFIMGGIKSYISSDDSREALYELSIFHQKFRKKDEGVGSLTEKDIHLGEVAFSRLKRILGE